MSKHIRSRHIFSGTAASSTDAESCKWVRKWRESCDARHASCMSPAIVGAFTLALLTMCHTFSRRMLMSSTPTPEIPHAHSVRSVCYIHFQTWDLVMTFLLCMCVAKRANSANRFSVLGSFVGTMISGCLLLLWWLFKQGENSSLDESVLDIPVGPRAYITSITKWFQIRL